MDQAYHAEALNDVELERTRQEKLKSEGRFSYTLDMPEMEEPYKLAAILEELGEVGRNVMARAGIVTDGDTAREALYKELTQVAALSVAWMEGLTAEMQAGVH